MDSPPHNSEDQTQDEGLNRLLRAALREDSGESAESSLPIDFAGVSQALLLSYLTGRATEEQREEVYAAMLRSESLRRLVGKLARDIEAAIGKAAIEPEPRPNLFGRSLAWFRELTPPFRFAWGLAPVAVMALVVVRIIGSNPMPFAESVQQSYESPGLFRGLSRGLEEPEYSDRASAISGLKGCLFWAGRDIQLREVPGEDTSDSRRLVVRIVDSKNNTLQTLETRIPGARLEHQKVAPMTAWLLFLPHHEVPQFSLQSFQMKSDSMRFRWTPDMGVRGSFLVTYPVAQGFLSTRCQPFVIAPSSYPSP